jgi:hypothetical protein
MLIGLEILSKKSPGIAINKRHALIMFNLHFYNERIRCVENLETDLVAFVLIEFFLLLILSINRLLNAFKNNLETVQQALLYLL